MEESKREEDDDLCKSVLMAFVRATKRPCTEAELLEAASSAKCTSDHLQSLVLSSRLCVLDPLGPEGALGETEVFRFKDSDVRVYWLGPGASAHDSAEQRPTPSTKEGDDAEALQAELAALRERMRELDAQIGSYAAHEKEYDKEIERHMQRVHEYNELKDIAQALMGRLATIEGILTRDLYKRFGLDLED